MLENLDWIHWRRARRAYASAADVPAWLRGVASADESVRYDALDRLRQWSGFKAAELAVPFLFELVLDPATPDREDLVFFLVSLAFGSEGFLSFSPTAAEEPRRWEPEERAPYEAVAGRIGSLVPLLCEAAPLRLAAAYALAWFPDASAGTAGEVRRAYDASAGEATRAMLLIALAMVSLHAPDKDEGVSFLRRIHSDEGSAMLRASAAAGLALLGAADDEVLRTISESIIDGSAGNPRIPWNDGDFDGFLAMVLPLTTVGREAAVAARLMDALPGGDVQSKGTITCALLGVVAPPADHRALSDLQRRALKAIDEHGRWVRNGERIVNFDVRVSGKGLPGDHDDFHSFVQAAEASARGEAVEWKPRERPPARRPSKPPAPVFPTVLFGAMILLWLLLVAIAPHRLSRTPGGWGLLPAGLLLLGLSVFSLRRSK